jgi:DNA-binding MarR family transcriptional regulator
MRPHSLKSRIRAVRRFNRFYTRKIGVLNEGVYRSPFSLIEVRILYELANHEAITATQLADELGLDAGYLSRILRGFGKRGLIKRSRSSIDARQSHLSLSAHGRKIFAPLDARSSEEVGALLGRFPAP